MKPLKVFIDAEFTEFTCPRLISIGMVAATGEECYIEVPFPYNECSAFVRDTVIPMLDRYPNAYCARPNMRVRLLSWLNLVRAKEQTVEVCFDYQTDWDLFVEGVDYEVPAWIQPRNVARNTNELLLYDFWRRAKLAGGEDTCHHALSDAKALAYAFRER